MKPSKSASTSSTGIGSSTACRRKAGTAPEVTVESTPSAPSPTRATSSTSAFSSGVHSSTEPSPVMSRSPTIWVARPPNAAPVPCVAVEVAPAIDW